MDGFLVTLKEAAFSQVALYGGTDPHGSAA
jgi:hypothetical protein